MKTAKTIPWVKYFLGIFAMSGMLLFTACDNNKRTTESPKTEADPEAGLGDADGVGIEGSTNTDTDTLNASDTTSY